MGEVNTSPAETTNSATVKTANPLGFDGNCTHVVLSGYDCLYFIYLQYLADGRSAAFLTALFDNIVQAITPIMTRVKAGSFIRYMESQTSQVVFAHDDFRGLSVVGQALVAIAAMKLNVSCDISFEYIRELNYPRSQADLNDFIVLDVIRNIQKGDMTKVGLSANDIVSLFATVNAGTFVELRSLHQLISPITSILQAIDTHYVDYLFCFGAYIGTAQDAANRQVALRVPMSLEITQMDVLVGQTLQCLSVTENATTLTTGANYVSRFRSFYMYYPSHSVVDVRVNRDIVAVIIPKINVSDIIALYYFNPNGNKTNVVKSTPATEQYSFLIQNLYEWAFNLLPSVVTRSIAIDQRVNYGRLFILDLLNDLYRDSRMCNYLSHMSYRAGWVKFEYPDQYRHILTNCVVTNVDFIDPLVRALGYNVTLDPLQLLSVASNVSSMAVNSLNVQSFKVESAIQNMYACSLNGEPAFSILSLTAHPVGTPVQLGQGAATVTTIDRAAFSRALFGITTETGFYFRGTVMRLVLNYVIRHATITDRKDLMERLMSRNMFNSIVSLSRYTLTSSPTFAQRDWFHRMTLGWLLSVLRMHTLGGLIYYWFDIYDELVAQFESKSTDIDRMITGGTPSPVTPIRAK